jgi:transposase
MIRAQIQLLRAIQATIAGLEKLIKELVAVHPRARLLAALPGVGQINLAQLLAEVGRSCCVLTPPNRPPPNAAPPR